MSKAQQQSAPGTTAMSATEVARYLQENPDFFQAHPEVLTNLELPHQQTGSVSLLERQQQVLREKIRGLELDIGALLRNARRNEFLFRTYSQLYQQLLQAEDLTELHRALSETFLEALGLAQLTLRLTAPEGQIPERFRFSADTHKQLLHKRFQDSSVYLGRLTAAEQRLLFPAQEVASVALVRLGIDGDLGLLAVGSADASHFDPDMDYLLISQLQTLLSVRLADILGRAGTAYAAS